MAGKVVGAVIGFGNPDGIEAFSPNSEVETLN